MTARSQTATRDGEPIPRGSRALAAAAMALLLLGLGFRVAPLLDRDGRLVRQFPSEDGYYMLTMARNLAMGRGLSIAEGTIPTNGTQPLMTGVWALCFAAVDGHRRSGLLLVQLLEILIALSATALLWRLGTRVLPEHEARTGVAALCAGLWFASPVAMPHTMNCLETGAYIAVVIAVMLVLVPAARPGPPGEARRRGRPWGVWRSVALGLLLGLAFWIRNDAVFVALACCATIAALGHAGLGSQGPWTTRVGHAVAVGGLAAAIASPWIVYNTVVFGHPVPVSGRVEGLVVDPWANLSLAPAAAFETAWSLVSIPHPVRTNPAVIAACLVLVLPVAIAAAASWRHGTAPQRRALLFVGVLGGCLLLFYTLFLGAPWFLGRFWAPLAAPCVLGWSALALAADRALRVRIPTLARAVAVWTLMAIVVAGVTLQQVRAYRWGKIHPHAQVVAWVEANLTEDTWVGAGQTGTLGFFHDRTINLGKVNPAALEGFKRGTLGQYVVDSPIEYIVDWTDACYWMTLPEVAGAFEVVQRDDEANLIVLRRLEPR